MKATFTTVAVQGGQAEIIAKMATTYIGLARTSGTDTYLQIFGSGIPGSAPLLKPEVKHTLHTYI